MPHEFVQTRRVEFADSDMAGIAHFANFFRWMEAAEHAFVRSLGHELHRDEEGEMSGFVRLRASAEYHAPLRYPDEFDVRLSVRAKTRSTLTYGFRFEQGGALAATGEVTVCSVARPRGGDSIASRPIPDDLAALIEIAPDEAPSTER